MVASCATIRARTIGREYDVTCASLDMAVNLPTGPEIGVPRGGQVASLRSTRTAMSSRGGSTEKLIAAARSRAATTSAE